MKAEHLLVSNIEGMVSSAAEDIAETRKISYVSWLTSCKIGMSLKSGRYQGEAIPVLDMRQGFCSAGFSSTTYEAA